MRSPQTLNGMMKSILEGRPALEAEVNKTAEVAGPLREKG